MLFVNVLTTLLHLLLHAAAHGELTGSRPYCLLDVDVDLGAKRFFVFGELDYVFNQARHMFPSNLSILLALLPELLPLLRISVLHGWDFLREYILDRQDLVKQLELLLGPLFVFLGNQESVQLDDVLESVDYKGFKGSSLQNLVVIDIQLLKRLQTFNFGQENK